MNPAEVTERYFASIRARDLDGLIALYAQDACFTLPNGREFSGIDAIREMHRSVFAAGGPIPTPLTSIAGGSSIAVEIANTHTPFSYCPSSTRAIINGGPFLEA